MEDLPQSPLFVGGEGPSDIHTSTLHTIPLSEPPHHEREAALSQGPGAELKEPRQSVGHQQVPREEREGDTSKRRRRRKVQIRRLVSSPANNGHQEPMDLELGDQSNSPDEDLGPEAPQSDPALVDSEMVPTYSSHGSAPLEIGDAMSDCTRVSFGAIQLEKDPDERTMIEGPDRDDALDHETRINRAAQRGSSEFEADNSSNISGSQRQQDLEEFLAGLRKAQEEQERLEVELEGQRLNEELGLSNQARLRAGESPQFEDRQGHTKAGKQKPTWRPPAKKRSPSEAPL